MEAEINESAVAALQSQVAAKGNATPAPAKPAPAPPPAAPTPAPIPKAGGPLPAPEDRAQVPEISDRFGVPKNTLYDMLRDGTLPTWRLGTRKVCTSWRAAAAYFDPQGKLAAAA